MDTEVEYKEFSNYWNEVIEGNSWTTLERQACFMGWMEAKKRCLKNAYTAEEIRAKLLELNPQIIENSEYTNPFLYQDIKSWYAELKKDR